MFSGEYQGTIEMHKEHDGICRVRGKISHMVPVTREQVRLRLSPSKTQPHQSTSTG